MSATIPAMQPASQNVITQTAVDPASVALSRAAFDRVAVGAVLGGVLGLAWGSALRSWMVILALDFGEQPRFTWQGTFGGILVPAAIMGAILGALVPTEGPSLMKRRRWALLSPLLLVLGPAIATDNFVSILVTTGMGSGAIGVALIGLSGGYALSGIGPRWLRWVVGFLSAALVLASAYGFGFAAGGVTMTPGKIFSALLFVLLMVLLIMGIGASTRYRHIQERPC
jgi:hypothetical protein